MHPKRERLIVRATSKQGSNNKFKTICSTEVCRFFEAENEVRYLHTISDVVRAIRKKGYKVRSRLSQIKKGSTVGSTRKQLAKLGNGFYIVRVESHVLLLSPSGTTIVDTDSRKRDRRKITHLYKVYYEV